MKKRPEIARTLDGMRTQYDFTGAVRAKYAARYRQGTNVVVLDPDVAKAFTDSRVVNRALRALLEALPPRPKRRARNA
jgi:hypothetical protein